MKKAFKFILILSLTILIFFGCGNNQLDDRLEYAADIVSESPQDALRLLDSVDYKQLSVKNRHYFDFLTVKATDKAFMEHQSDSLILDVIAYAKSHQSEVYYPEALYYGGRVYSDMGDYPTALNYFQQSLEQLPSDTKDLDLKSRILSQTGNILDELRLYDQAVPYIKESIEISRQMNDTAGEVQDIQLLGTIYLRVRHLESADSCFRLAIMKSQNLPEYHAAKSRMYIAGIKYEMGQLDSALLYIRTTVDKVNPRVRNTWLAYASDIYMRNGLCDTAYQYASELIDSDDLNNKGIGYNIIFNDSVFKYIPKDSIVNYSMDYHSVVERSFNEHQAQLAITQQSNYNYGLHQREREKTEKKADALFNWIIVTVFALFAMSWIILLFRYRTKQRIIRLRVALENAEKLIKSIEASKLDDTTEAKAELNSLHDPSSIDETEEDLREKLKKKLFELYKAKGDSRIVPTEILQSDSYKKLSGYLSEGKEIRENEPLWTELEESVLQCSPKFTDNLRLLVGGRLSSFDIQTAVLIKCGVTPSQMTILFNRSKGAISSRRESLCKRIFGEKKGTKVIDAIIRLL